MEKIISILLIFILSIISIWILTKIYRYILYYFLWLFNLIIIWPYRVIGRGIYLIALFLRKNITVEIQMKRNDSSREWYSSEEYIKVGAYVQYAGGIYPHTDLDLDIYSEKEIFINVLYKNKYRISDLGENKIFLSLKKGDNVSLHFNAEACDIYNVENIDQRIEFKVKSKVYFERTSLDNDYFIRYYLEIKGEV